MFDTICCIVGPLNVDDMAVVALILRPRDRAELLAGIIGDERIDVAWFKVAWGRLPVGEGVWTQETHGPDLAIKNYFSGRGAAQDVASQRVDGEHAVREKRCPRRVFLQIVCSEAQVGPDNACSVLHYSVGLMPMRNAEFVLDAGGVPEVVAGAGHESRIAVCSNCTGEAEELEAKKKEEHRTHHEENEVTK